VVGASQQDTQVDEDIDSQPPAAQQSGGAANKYEIVGTLRDAQAQKPEWVAEIVKVWSSQFKVHTVLRYRSPQRVSI